MVLIIPAVCFSEPAEIKCPSIKKSDGTAIGTIAADGTATTETLTLIRKSGFEGYFSVQPIFTGTGTLKIQYQRSANNVNWSPAVDITTSATSGTFYDFPAAGVSIFGGYIRLVLTETGAANSVTITNLYRCSQ